MKNDRLRLPLETAGDKNLEFLESAPERAAVGCENCYCAQYAIIFLGLYVYFPALDAKLGKMFHIPQDPGSLYSVSKF